MVLAIERQPKEFYINLEEYVVKKAKKLKNSKYWFLVDEAKWYDGEKKEWFVLDVNKWVSQYDEGRRINPDEIFVRPEKGAKPSPTDEYLRAEAYKRWLVEIGEYDNFLKHIEDDWLDKHEKFVEFCANIKPQIVALIKASETGTEAAVALDNMVQEVTDYHMSHPKPMNVHSKNDIIFGLYYCLARKDPKIDIRMSHDQRSLIFSMTS